MSGVFGKEFKLGHVVALFSPFLLFSVRRYKLPIRIAVWGLLVLITILSGSRGAWVILALCVGGFILFEHKNSKRFVMNHLLIALLSISASGLTLYYGSDYVKHRVEQTELLFSGDKALIDTALSLRLSIWETALETAKANKFNGVGVRAFRDAYFDYAKESDHFKKQNERPTHPHQIILEVAAEAGAVGLIGLVGFYGLFVWRLFRSGFNTSVTAVPGIALFAAVFPINTTQAFYSSFWGMLVWLLVAYYCASGSPSSAMATDTLARPEKSSQDTNGIRPDVV